MPRQEKQKIGSFWVDTGTILVGDPCQFIHDPGETPHITYSGVGDLFYEQGEVHTEPALVVSGVEVFPASERRGRAAVVTLPGRVGLAAGFVVTVGTDGWYPVYVVKDRDGTVLRIIIECGGQVAP